MNREPEPDPRLCGATDRRRWAILVVGFVAMTAGCTFQYGLPYALPALRAGGLSLSQAGLVIASPIVGLLLTLVVWGAVADRWGERRVLVLGLAAAGTLLLAAMTVDGAVAWALMFVLAGGASAAVHSASGRLILGWFPGHLRGRAMAVRQTAQPLGVALAALVMPPLTAHGMGGVLAFAGGMCLVAAGLVAVAVVDPPPPTPGADHPTTSPYRGSSVLWRTHAASALLVVPQFVVATFALAFLVEAQDWSATAAGRLLAAAAAGGAGLRLVVGYWSDRAGARLRPFRVLTVGVTVVLVVLAAGAGADLTGTVVALVVATMITVSPNGLAFTAVAEHAGGFWAGRALGVQNTGQNLVASLVPPTFGALISVAGFPVAFLVAAAFPLVAIGVVPVAVESKRSVHNAVDVAAAGQR